MTRQFVHAPTLPAHRGGLRRKHYVDHVRNSGTHLAQYRAFPPRDVQASVERSDIFLSFSFSCDCFSWLYEADPDAYVDEKLIATEAFRASLWSVSFSKNMELANLEL